MKKRLFIFALTAVLVMMTFVSCSSSQGVAVNISGAEISEGIYTYFYDYVLSNKDELGLEEADGSKKAEDETVRLLKEYVAVNSMSERLGISLSYTLKAQTADDTDSRWELFGKYYSSIGMTKQDLNKILTNKALKSALVDYYYGEDSKIKPTSTEELKNEFTKKYIGIKVIAASLTTTDTMGNTVALDNYELSNIRNMFQTMRDRLNGGTDIDSVYSAYITNLDLIGTQSLETYVMTESSVGYGEDFFSKISSLSYNTAAVIEDESTIYLAYRIDISGDDLGYFVTYKSDILEELCLSKLEKKISAEAEKYKLIKEHTSVTSKIRGRVEKKHG